MRGFAVDQLRMCEPGYVARYDDEYGDYARGNSRDAYGDTSWGTMTLERSSRAAHDVAAARRHFDDVDMPDMPTYYRTPVRDFIDRYGWRAYALPILTVITVIALMTAGGAPPRRSPSTGADPGAAHTSAPPVANGPISLRPDTPSGTANHNVLKGSALPTGPAYTIAGDGTFRVLKGTTKVFGSGPLYRYDIEVENGITGIDLNNFASLVDKTLADPRSWAGHGVSLQRVDSGSVNFHVTLTSSMTVRQYCGYDVPVETSCYAAAGSVSAASVNRVVLNDSRWVRGATAYVGDLATYRVYMINHEDGHALGHNHAHQCLADGLAPAMMQQTFGLVSAATGQHCAANPWPYPPGAADAPGAEQLDTASNNEYNLGD